MISPLQLQLPVCREIYVIDPVVAKIFFISCLCWVIIIAITDKNVLIVVIHLNSLSYSIVIII